jgi:hypothetical protein
MAPNISVGEYLLQRSAGAMSEKLERWPMLTGGTFGLSAFEASAVLVVGGDIAVSTLAFKIMDATLRIFPWSTLRKEATGAFPDLVCADTMSSSVASMRASSDRMNKTFLMTR